MLGGCGDLLRAVEEFEKTSAPKGDALLEEMEKVVAGSSGGSMVKLFEVLRKYSKRWSHRNHSCGSPPSDFYPAL